MSNIPPEVFNKIRENQQNRLTELDLSDYDLDYIPDEVFYFTHLTKLNLSNNKLTTLPDKIANLSNLIRLDLSARRKHNK